MKNSIEAFDIKDVDFIDVDNTEIAFAHRSDEELRESRRLFRLMNNRGLVTMGSKITPALLKFKIPLVKPMVKATIFRQFVGGETLQDTQAVIDLLSANHTLTILDYGAESKSTEEELDGVVKALINTIDLAAANSSVPVISTKLTSLTPNSILIKMQSGAPLTDDEEAEKQKLIRRLDSICKKAYDQKVGVMVDAEESWMQDTIDSLVDEMMETYNKKEVIVYNTFQLYRSDKLDFLKASQEKARSRGYLLGAKLVRGAYMKKEADYAADNGTDNPIHTSKSATDRDYNQGLVYCVDNYQTIASVCASHNAKSNLLQAYLIDQKSINPKHPHLNFCQLYGMSDNLTFNLAKAGFNVAKYVPYGPLDEVIPYLIRRAQENTAVTGDMSRELSFIVDEIKRRKNARN